MRLAPALLTASLALTLHSCSGTMDARACLRGGRLAFEFEDVPRFLFFKGPPEPDEIGVQIPGEPSWQGEKEWKRRQMWHAQHYANAQPENRQRSIIFYGQPLDGFTVTQGPRPLRAGVTYRIWVHAGGLVGSADFTYSTQLPTCTKPA